MNKDGDRVYIVYDERAISGDTDDAGILESFDAPSNRKAKRAAFHMWSGTPYALYGCTFQDGQAIQDETPLAIHRGGYE